MSEYAEELAVVALLDPVSDPRFPRISADTEDVAPSWPDGWGDEATERDLTGITLDVLTVPGLGGARPVLPEEPQLAAMIPRGATVNLNDYRSAAVKGWGTGWPTCGGAKGNTVIVTANRSGVRFSVHRRVSVMFDHLIDTMEARGYLCKAGQCGAYNCRAIAGTNTASNHSWALAADINWTDNPYTSTGRHTMPLWVPRQVFNPYGWAWGGDYSGARKDFMHVEFLGTPAQADEQTARVLAGSGVTPTPGPAPSGARVLELTTPPMEGDDVRQVQRVLRAWYGLPTTFVDGFYGPSTVAYVRRVQAGTPPQPKLTADGAVGPDTRRKLGLPG